MKRNTCNSCLWFVKEIEPPSAGWDDCHLNPPESKGMRYPMVWPDYDWCSGYKEADNG